MDPGFLGAPIAEYTYLILAPAAFLFGAPSGLVAGFLLRIDVLQMIPTVLALAAGELTADVFWYWLGRRYGESFAGRYGRYIGVTRSGIAAAKSLFNAHHDIIIFTSKLTAGFGFGTAIMFTAGMSQVPFRRYMMLNIAGQFLWTAGLLAIGYFLGHIFLKVNDVVEKMMLFALGAILLVSLIGFARYLRDYMLGDSSPR